MRQIPEDILYDSRLVERHIVQGLITREDVDKRLEKLAYATDLGEPIDLQKLGSKKSANDAEA